MPTKRTTTAKSKSTSTAKKASAKKTTVKKTTAKKAAPKKTSAANAKKTTTAKKTATKKAATAKTTKKVSNVKKTTKKATTKKTTTKKSTSKTESVKPKTALKKKATVKEVNDNASIIEDVAVTTISPNSAATTGAVDFQPYEIDIAEDYMDEEQLGHFTEILKRWKQDLMEEVDRTVLHMKDDAANFPDPNDRATQEEEFSLELRTRDRERKLIKKIDEALARIEADEYGFCEMCGVEIGIRRLEARPTATLCIDCKTLEEIREKQLAG